MTLDETDDLFGDGKTTISAPLVLPPPPSMPEEIDEIVEEVDEVIEDDLPAFDDGATQVMTVTLKDVDDRTGPRRRFGKILAAAVASVAD